MKRLLSLILMLTMVFCGNTAFAAAPNSTDRNDILKSFEFIDIPEGYCEELQRQGFKVVEDLLGLELIEYEGTEEIVNIPGGIYKIGKRAFEGCDNIKEVVFPQSEVFCVIDEYAFKDCTGLKEIIFPNRLRAIEKCAFMNCKSLNDINMPASTFSIGEGAFVGCESLSSIKLNSGLKYIKDNAFNGCGNVRNIEFPETILKIGENAFSNCRNLENVKFNISSENANKCHIERLAFYNCENLKEANCVESIYANQFVFPDGCIVNGKKISWDEKRLNLVDEAKNVQEKMADLLKKLEIDEVDLTQYMSANLGAKVDIVAKLLNRYDGYSALPKVVDEVAFDELSKGKPILYRGLSDRDGKPAAEYADNFRYREFYNGIGSYGNGSYASTNVRTALKYSGREDNIGILKMCLNDSAKIIKFRDLEELFSFYKNVDTNYFTKLYENDTMCNGLENLDIGNFAEIAGYDAICIDGVDEFGGDYYVILNRGDVIVSSEYADISKI